MPSSPQDTVPNDPAALAAELTAMVEEVAASPALYRPSDFWVDLNRVNSDMLGELGLHRFKRTVAQNYYNWLIVDPADVQYANALRHWKRWPVPWPLLTRMEPPGDALRTLTGLEKSVGPRQLDLYRRYVGMLWEFARREDRLGLTKRLEEPELGDPIRIWRLGRRISQDLANSIREVNAMFSDGAPTADGSPGRFAELGAGYGRVGYALLQTGAARYFVFDIPPALQVSQWYLTRLFPDRRIFRFRPMRDFASHAAELAAADIAFLTPNQMALFPDGWFDCFFSISTLPEMSAAQIDNYLVQMQRISRGLVYLKQWLAWTNPADGNSVHPDTFRLGPDWVPRMDRTDAIQTLFFERLWRRRN